MSKTGRLLFQIVLFASFGTLMYISDIMMDLLPNIHLIGMFTVTFTVVYRTKALIPIYVYVFLHLFFTGFSPWTLPYLYIWTVLWGIVMLLPKHMKPAVAVPVYIGVCALHGLGFGLLYAPAQILLFAGGDWNQFWPWVIGGLYFDWLHCVGNFFSGTLIYPLIAVLRRLPGAVQTKRIGEHNENL